MEAKPNGRLEDASSTLPLKEMTPCDQILWDESIVIKNIKTNLFIF
jgi:hypothetical protein